MMKKIINAFFYILLSIFLVASVQADVLITYYHNDLLGSPVAATDENGTLLWQEEYMPFGERVEKDPKSKNNRQWHTGKPLDEATGLTYLGARYCDSKIGRFMAVDPVGVDPANLHSFNRYAFVNNNPYKYVDPDGENAVVVFGFLAFTVVVAAVAVNTIQNTLDILDRNPNTISIGPDISGSSAFNNESNSGDDGESNDTSADEIKEETPKKLSAKERRKHDKERTKKQKERDEHFGDMTQAHKDQKQGGVDELIDKERGIKDAYPDQPGGKTKQRIKNRMNEGG